MFFSEALQSTMMLLVNAPGRSRGSKLTSMYPDLDGNTGSLLHAGDVQPQDVCTVLIISGLSPVFLYTKRYCTMPPSSRTSPKSYSKVSNLMTGCANNSPPQQITDKIIINNNLIIVSLFFTCFVANTVRFRKFLCCYLRMSARRGVFAREYNQCRRR